MPAGPVMPVCLVKRVLCGKSWHGHGPYLLSNFSLAIVVRRQLRHQERDSLQRSRLISLLPEDRSACSTSCSCPNSNQIRGHRTFSETTPQPRLEHPLLTRAAPPRRECKMWTCSSCLCNSNLGKPFLPAARPSIQETSGIVLSPCGNNRALL
jgi:hypothetical protein